MEINKDQWKKSQKAIKEDMPKIKERLNLIYLAQVEHSSADYIHNVDLIGADDQGRFVAIQHKLARKERLPFKMDENKKSEKGYSWHSGKITHYVIHREWPDLFTSLWIFDASIVQRVVDSSFKLKDLKKVEESNFQKLFWMNDEDFLGKYIEIEKNIGGFMDDFKDMNTGKMNFYRNYEKEKSEHTT